MRTCIGSVTSAALRASSLRLPSSSGKAFPGGRREDWPGGKRDSDWQTAVHWRITPACRRRGQRVTASDASTFPSPEAAPSIPRCLLAPYVECLGRLGGHSLRQSARTRARNTARHPLSLSRHDGLHL